MTIFKISRLMIVILSLSLMSVAPPAHADNWKEATKAYAQKKYAAAMKLFRPLAEKGHAAAQYQVALMHKMGLGVPKSEKEARKWSRLAAKQGNTQAQLLLGSLYYTKEGSESPNWSRPTCGTKWRRPRAIPKQKRKSPPSARS